MVTEQCIELLNYVGHLKLIEVWLNHTSIENTCRKESSESIQF